MSGAIDPLALAIIRAGNSYDVLGLSDWECICIYGQNAQPFADALRQAIREEVERVVKQ